MSELNQYTVSTNTFFLVHVCNMYDIPYVYNNQKLIIKSELDPVYLNQFSIKQWIFFIRDIVSQIYYLESINYTIVNFNINDFVKVDNHFIFIKTEKIVSTNNSLFQIYDLEKHSFMSPQQNHVKSLPMEFHKSSCYYSLGILAKKHIQIEKQKGTQLYWFIQHATENDENKRYLLSV